MATTKGFSLASFVEYGNRCINNANNSTPVMQEAFKKDLKKAIAHAGYPSKDEIGVVDEINDFELTNTLAQVPTLVSSFMKDEQRAFDLPAVDPNTCPASIKVVAVDEKTKTGTIMLGDKKGEQYTSTVAAHEELSVKNRRDAFKK
jgi:hypothetical protein